MNIQSSTGPFSLGQEQGRPTIEHPGCDRGAAEFRPEATMLTASHILGATPSRAYSWRAPSPPHIHVPQATLEKELLLQDYLDFQCDPQDREILTAVTQGNHVAVDIRHWVYEWRRSAQSILSFLYLGPSAAARDVEMLKKEGITLLLVIRNTMMAGILSGQKIAEHLGIEAASVDVQGNQQLIAAFPTAIRMINDHLVSVYRRQVANGISPGDSRLHGKVLVFCESGNEKSASVVAAYLMYMYRLDMVGAVQYLQAQRFCVSFDDGLKNLLLSYQQLLDAQRSVTSSTQQQNFTVSAKTKRGRDDIDMDDVDMDLEREDDELRFGKRSDFTPFYDASSGQ